MKNVLKKCLTFLLVFAMVLPFFSQIHGENEVKAATANLQDITGKGDGVWSDIFYSSESYVVMNATIRINGAVDRNGYPSLYLYTGSGEQKFKLQYNPDGISTVLVADGGITQDGVNIPAWQKYCAGSPLEQIFTNDGVEIKLVRMNTWAYLFAKTANGYELIAKRAVANGDVTNFAIFSESIGSATYDVTNITVEIGMAATIEAIEGTTIDLNDGSVYFPIDSASWTLRGKATIADSSVLTSEYVNNIILVGPDADRTKSLSLMSLFAGSLYANWPKHDWAEQIKEGIGTLLASDGGEWLTWIRSGGAMYMQHSANGTDWIGYYNHGEAGDAVGGICLWSEIVGVGAKFTITELTKNDVVEDDASDLIRIACVGDSITQGVGSTDELTKSYPAQLQELLGEEYKVKNFGVGGTTVRRDDNASYAYTSRYMEGLNFNPNIVIIMLGTNDAMGTGSEQLAEFEQDYRLLINDYRALESQPKIFLALPATCYETITPRQQYLPGIIEVIKKIAEDEDLETIDINSLTANHADWFPDGVHPHDDAYVEIATEFSKHIRAYENAEIEKRASFKGSEVTLGDRIGVNFYMELSEDTVNDEQAYMSFTLPGTNHTAEKIMISDAEYDEESGYYVFSCGIAAKEMASDIKFKVVFGDGVETKETTYQVKNYGEIILNDTDGVYRDIDKAMVKAMLNYGAYAQLHFNYNTDNLANAGMEEADRTLVMPAIDASYKGSLDGTVEGITYYGTSLMLTEKTVIRHYFELSEGQDITDYAFAYGESALTPIQKGNFYYVEITDIVASKLGEMYVLNVTKGNEAISLVYSPYTNVKSIVEGNNYTQESKNMMAALYAYGQMAEKWINANNNSSINPPEQDPDEGDFVPLNNL